MRGSPGHPGTTVREICLLAEEAGARAMHFYHGRASVAFKQDSSPLTDADRASHDFLTQSLPGVIPGIPVISEESMDPTLGLREADGRFWLVDPLDGTKEFLKGTGEFTVNIALVEQGRPVIGVVHAPALGVIYFADLAGGAFRRSQDEAPVAIRAERAHRGPLRVVASKDHAGPLIEAMLARFPRHGMGPPRRAVRRRSGRREGMHAGRQAAPLRQTFAKKPVHYHRWGSRPPVDNSPGWEFADLGSCGTGSLTSDR